MESLDGNSTRRRGNLSRRDTSSKNRERSTSTESHASSQSGALEWDHSADVGVIESATNSFEMYAVESPQRNANELGELLDTPSSQASASVFEAGDGNIANLLGPRSQCLPNLVYAYSTPSASPVPPPAMDYSPVELGQLDAVVQGAQEDLQRSATQVEYNPPPKKSGHAESSENKIITESRSSSSVTISGASSDREYDTGRKTASRYVPDWRTNGITRSEIEYEQRKKNGTLSSAASSVFLLKVDDQIKSQCQDLPEGSNSDSNRSSGCSSMDSSFLRHMKDNSSLDGMKYEILKSQRDYYMEKVWKQIIKLEKINQYLQMYKYVSTNESENDDGSHGNSSEENRHRQSSSRTNEALEEEDVSDSDASVPERKLNGATKIAKNECCERQNMQDTSSKLSDDSDTSGRMSPVGFFIPFFCDDLNDNVLPDNAVFKVKGLKTIEECLKEHNPQCYESIKERDDFIITIKRERQMHSETVSKNALESEIIGDKIDDFLRRNYHQVDEKERQRLKTFWEFYMKFQQVTENEEKGWTGKATKRRTVITSKEMKERTRRLRMNDPAIVAKQKREAEERRKMTTRTLQKTFSTNLRMFRKLKSVNIPDRMKLGPHPP